MICWRSSYIYQAVPRTKGEGGGTEALGARSSIPSSGGLEGALEARSFWGQPRPLIVVISKIHWEIIFGKSECLGWI